MACLEMYNSSDQHKGLGVGTGGGVAGTSSAPPPMSPRISFSNDFAESSSHHSNNSQQHICIKSRDQLGPASSDFEFSVSNYSMMSADELFSKGRLLPLRENSCPSYNRSSNSTSSMFGSSRPTTLRDELLVDDEDSNDDFSLKPPIKGRWKGFLGLRKSHIGSKRVEKSTDNTNFHVSSNLSNSNSMEVRFADARKIRVPVQPQMQEVLMSSEGETRNNDMEVEM